MIRFRLIHIAEYLQGTYAAFHLYETDLQLAKEAETAWYRSKETIPIVYPFVGGGHLSNKKWPLIEEITTYPFTIYEYLDACH